MQKFEHPAQTQFCMTANGELQYEATIEYLLLSMTAQNCYHLLYLLHTELKQSQ